MKNFLLTAAVCFSSIAFAQIGINTASPKSTLDVSAKRNDTGIADNTQTYGLLPPRITRAELTDNTALYDTNQTGAIIYITDVSAGDTNSPRTNINAVGYYYFDGTLWQKISLPYTATNGVTMSGNNVKLGGSIIEPTTISGVTNVNKLNITASGIDAINFGSNTFSLDATNNRVGIGINNPSEKLDVAGNISVKTNQLGTASSVKFYEDLASGSNSISIQAPSNLASNRTLTLPSNAPVNGYVLTTNAAGVTQWGAMNPASATLASISLSNEALATTAITNGGVDGSNVTQRFFQKFDTTVTDPNGRFNVSNGTYTVAQSGIYLISAYIMPNAIPSKNLSGYYYPVNLEIRKNAGTNPSGGTIIMDNATIRWATPGQPALRYSVLVTGMVSLNAGDTLNAVVYLSGTNATAASTSGVSYPASFTYASVAEFKALFSVTAL